MTNIFYAILIAAIRATFRVHLTTLIAVTDQGKRTEKRRALVTKEWNVIGIRCAYSNPLYEIMTSALMRPFM
jgi:hypothetical protein